MQNLNWKSSEITLKTYRVRKREYGKNITPEEDAKDIKLVKAHEEKLYSGDSEKGGLYIARVPENSMYCGSLECVMWIKTSHWATGHPNAQGVDNVLVYYDFGGEEDSMSSTTGHITNFNRLLNGESNLREFFQKENLDKLIESDLIERLKGFVLKVADSEPMPLLA